MRSDIRPTALLLQCLSTRPELRNLTQNFILMLGSGANDDNIAEILQILPNVNRFDLWGKEGSERWVDLSMAMKNAITVACQRPTLRTLGLTGFLALPRSLLCTSTQLHNLSVSSVPFFTEHEPHRDVGQNYRVGEPHIPPNHFSGLRKIECVYAPAIRRHRWLETAIESSTTSGSLHTLSLASMVAPALER